MITVGECPKRSITAPFSHTLSPEKTSQRSVTMKASVLRRMASNSSYTETISVITALTTARY